QLRGILSARLGHLWPAAATTAGGLGGFADPVAGFEALGDQVVADGGDEADLSVAGGGEHDGVGGALLAERVDDTAELVVGGAGEFTDDELAAAEVGGFREQFA